MKTGNVMKLMQRMGLITTWRCDYTN